MIIDRFTEWIRSKLSIHAICETLTCKYCGQEYASRGKKDPGYCKECEEDLLALARQDNLIGGPLGNDKTGKSNWST